MATSPDGINFTKHGGNPIVTWFPNDSGEEGAVSSAAVLDTNGEIVLYYGANSEESATTVNADGRLAVSSNGLDFTDQGIVLDHDDSSVWGSGDELFPIAAIRDDGQWVVYYLPNGTPQSGKLGVAWGTTRSSLDSADAAREGSNTISGWGTGGTAKIDTGTWALFVNDVRSQPPEIQVRTLSLTAPDELSAPVETYRFPDVRMATVRLDAGAATWFMYYRRTDGSAYGVKLAPGVWHHLAMVADTEAAKLRLYVDGLEVGASPKAFSGSLADLAPHDYYIGTGDPLVERWDYRMRGVIDEVFLFDRALTAGEIAALAVDPGPLEILVDGFESGDTAAWSVTTP